MKPAFEILLDRDAGVFVARRTDHPELNYAAEDAIDALEGLIDKLHKLMDDAKVFLNE